MSLVRVPLTLAAALAFHVSMSPPSTPQSDIPKDERAVCTTARLITTILTKGFFWASALTDTLVVLAPHFDTSLSSLPPISVASAEKLLVWLKHSTQWNPDFSLQSLPLVTIAGTSLAVAGAYLRSTSYHALGQFYACSNQGEGPCVPRVARTGHGHAHALITTGPYAYIRHPGYAGLMLCTVGLAVLQPHVFKTGGGGIASLAWGREDVSRVGVSADLRTVALVCAIISTVGAIRRMWGEERSLKSRFKGEWEAWARKVPYKLVPGLY